MGEIRQISDAFTRLRSETKERGALALAGKERPIPDDLPLIYHGCTFAGWDSSVRDVTAFRDWSGDPAFVVMFGTQGTGKSHLAAAKFVQWSACGEWGWFGPPRPRWWKVASYLEQLKQEMQEDRGRSHILAKRCDLLVLDDLGAERATDWSHAELTELISHRWNNLLPTVITTNLDAQGLAQWDAPIASRLLGFEAMQMDFTELADYRQGSN